MTTINTSEVVAALNKARAQINHLRGLCEDIDRRCDRIYARFTEYVQAVQELQVAQEEAKIALGHLQLLISILVMVAVAFYFFGRRRNVARR